MSSIKRFQLHYIDREVKIWGFSFVHYRFRFYKLIEYIIQKICHGVKCIAKICAIGETECNETCSLYVRRTKNGSEEKEGMAEREKRED